MSKDENVSNKELLNAVSNGFSKLEDKIDKNREAIEENREAIAGNRKAVADNREAIQENRQAIESLDQKIDGVRNSLDAEIVRHTDDHADHEKRITALEEKVAEKA